MDNLQKMVNDIKDIKFLYQYLKFLDMDREIIKSGANKVLYQMEAKETGSTIEDVVKRKLKQCDKFEELIVNRINQLK